LEVTITGGGQKLLTRQKRIYFGGASGGNGNREGGQGEKKKVRPGEMTISKAADRLHYDGRERAEPSGKHEKRAGLKKTRLNNNKMILGVKGKW